MIFAHDTEVALAAAAALVNTDGGDDEHLPDIAALDEFVRAWGWTGDRQRDEAELRAVASCDRGCGGSGRSTSTAVVEIVNGLLREASALPQLVQHDDWDYHLHATPPDAPLATRMAVEAAMAFVDVVRGKELTRLRTCEFPTCATW